MNIPTTAYGTKLKPSDYIQTSIGIINSAPMISKVNAAALESNFSSILESLETATEGTFLENLTFWSTRSKRQKNIEEAIDYVEEARQLISNITPGQFVSRVNRTAYLDGSVAKLSKALQSAKEAGE